MKLDVVMEGGGVKGLAFLGALEELEARGHTIARLVGTSAGAIVATLLAAGYSASRLREAITRRDADGKLYFADALDVPDRITREELASSQLAGAIEHFDIPLVPARLETQINHAVLEAMLKARWFRQVFSFIEWGGFYEGRRNREFFASLLEELEPGLSDLTFEELFAKTGRDITLVATDIEGQRMLALNHRTSPRVPITWATRMSMGIPLLWREVIWQKEWGKYIGMDITGHAIVDGGVISNFPIHLISYDLAEVREIMGEDDPKAIPNLGLLIDESLWAPELGEVPEEKSSDTGVLLIDGPWRRISKLLKTMLSARDRLVIEACLKDNEICRLPAAGYDTIDFDLNKERCDGLIAAARRATAEYLDTRGF